MTENEAKEILDGIDEVRGDLPEDGDDVEIALMMAKDALAEIQQYRAIGTIDEFKALKEDKNFLEFLYNQILPNEMEQYLSMYRMKDKVAVNGYADQCGLMPAT